MHTNKLQFTNRESQILTYYVPSVLQTLEFYNNIGSRYRYFIYYLLGTQLMFVYPDNLFILSLLL